MQALQCPVNYYPVKLKGGAGFGHEHHLSLPISPKPGINEVDNCLFILLAPAPMTRSTGDGFLLLSRRFFSPSPSLAPRINQKSSHKDTTFFWKSSKISSRWKTLCTMQFMHFNSSISDF